MLLNNKVYVLIHIITYTFLLLNYFYYFERFTKPIRFGNANICMIEENEVENTKINIILILIKTLKSVSKSL